MDTKPTPYEALEEAVSRIGSQSELARICGVGQPAVWKWLNTTKRLPAEHVLVVEAATGVSRNHLRPDIYPLGLREGAPFPFPEDDLGDCAPVVACDRSALLQPEERP